MSIYNNGQGHYRVALYYDNCSFRRKADLQAKVLDPDHYNEDSYAEYYCTSGCQMPSFDELAMNLQQLLYVEINKQMVILDADERNDLI